MERNVLRNSIRLAKRYLVAASDNAHDISHAKRVAANAVLIGGRIGYGDRPFLSLCAWWHDVGRGTNDEHHEEINARLLRDDLARRGCSAIETGKAYQAVRHHRWSMRPRTIPGRIIYDADKLDFISIDRWRKCLHAGQCVHLREIEKLLPRLGRIFHFDESREIYEKRLPAFMKFYSAIKGNFEGHGRSGLKNGLRGNSRV